MASGWAPKSLSGLMLFGLMFIAVPLLVAIITAALQIRTLATTGQKIVVEGVTAARASQQLFSQIASLERTARLYDVLNDPKLLESYEQEDETFSVTRVKLYVDATQATRQTLTQLAGTAARHPNWCADHAREHRGHEYSGTYDAASRRLSALVDKVAEQSNDQIDAEVAALQAPD